MAAIVEILLDGRMYSTGLLKDKTTQEVEDSIYRALESNSTLTFDVICGGRLILFPASIVRAAFHIDEWDV